MTGNTILKEIKLVEIPVAGDWVNRQIAIEESIITGKGSVEMLVSRETSNDDSWMGEIRPIGEKISGTTENWENGTLGCDAKHARRASPEVEKAVNEALGLVPTRLNLDVELVKKYEAAGKAIGLIPEALMRKALDQYIRDFSHAIPL